MQRSRSRAGDDRATGTSRGTIPTGGAIAPATLTATSNTTPPGESGVSTDLDLIMAGYIPRFVPNVKPPSISIPEAERLLLAQQNLARQNAARSNLPTVGPISRPLTFEQEVQNLINSPGFDANASLPSSPLDALAGDSVQIFDENDLSGDLFLNPNLRNDEVMIFDENDLSGDVFLNPSLPQDPKNFGDEFGGNIRPRLTSTNVAPRVADVRMLLNEFNQNQGSGIASLPTGITGDPVTDANIAGFRDQGIAPDAAIDEVFLPPASGTTTPRPISGDDTNQNRLFPEISYGDDTNRNRAFSDDPMINLALRTAPPTGLNTLNPFAQVGSRMARNILDKINEGGEAITDDSGMIVGVVHDGILGKVYTGRPGFNPFAPPERPEKDVNDPCPPGFQLIDGVCRPMFDIAGPATPPPPPVPGSNFQMAPTSGFPTSFSPMTQATPVSLPDPFVLSPTGAAIGRRV